MIVNASDRSAFAWPVQAARKLSVSSLTRQDGSEIGMVLISCIVGKVIFLGTVATTTLLDEDKVACPRNPPIQPLPKDALRSRFGKARWLAGMNFQFRDIQAKAATDTGDLAHSQKLLAQKSQGPSTTSRRGWESG